MIGQAVDIAMSLATSKIANKGSRRTEGKGPSQSSEAKTHTLILCDCYVWNILKNHLKFDRHMFVNRACVTDIALSSGPIRAFSLAYDDVNCQTRGVKPKQLLHDFLVGLDVIKKRIENVFTGLRLRKGRSGSISAQTVDENGKRSSSNAQCCQTKIKATCIYQYLDYQLLKELFLASVTRSVDYSEANVRLLVLCIVSKLIHKYGVKSGQANNCTPCSVNLLRIPALKVFSGNSVGSFRTFRSECCAMETVKGAILDFGVSVFQSHVDVSRC
jgi:hypothetical protein